MLAFRPGSTCVAGSRKDESVKATLRIRGYLLEPLAPQCRCTKLYWKNSLVAILVSQFMFRLVQRCINLQASSMNVAQLNQEWFVAKAGLLKAEESAGSVFTPVMAMVKTDRMQLIVQPPNVQFYPQQQEETDSDVILEFVPRFTAVFGVGNLIGITTRFVWQSCELAADETHSTAEVTRRLFAGANPVETQFPNDRAAFGYFVQTTDDSNTQTSLDVRPVDVNDAKGPHQHLQIFVSFASLFVAENLMDIAEDHCKRWPEFRATADSIVGALTERAKHE